MRRSAVYDGSVSVCVCVCVWSRGGLYVWSVCVVARPCRSLLSQLITWLSFAINIVMLATTDSVGRSVGRSAAAHWCVADGRAVMLATWNARASLADTPLHRNDTAIPATLNE